MSKLQHRPNENAIKTKWGWQDATTGELLVSAVGAFKSDAEADVEKPNSKSAMEKAGKGKKRKRKGKGEQEGPEPVVSGEQVGPPPEEERPEDIERGDSV